MATFHIHLRSSLGNWRFRASLEQATKEALRKSLCHLLQDFGYVSVQRAVSKRLMDLANHCIACREGNVPLAPASLLSYVRLTATPRNRSHRPPFPSPRSRSVTGKSPVCLAEPSPSPKRFRYWCPKQSLPTRTGVLIQRATWRPDDRGLICAVSPCHPRHLVQGQANWHDVLSKQNPLYEESVLRRHGNGRRWRARPETCNQPPGHVPLPGNFRRVAAAWEAIFSAHRSLCQ